MKSIHDQHHRILAIKCSLLLFIFCTTILNQAKQTSAQRQANQEQAENTCDVYNSIGFNDLTPIDVVVKNPDTNLACIKARFSLAIKVESMIPIDDDDDDDEDADAAGAGKSAESSSLEKMIKSSSDSSPQAADEGAPKKVKKVKEKKIVLGYLPLEHVTNIEDSCPESIKPPASALDADKKPTADGKQPPPDEQKKKELDSGDKATKDNDKKELRKADDEDENQLKQNDDELEMIVTFECGKLAFTFQRNDTRTYLSSIKGLVKLDHKVVREFKAQRPMLITSDPERHFKYDDLIAIESESESQAYIVSANLYFTEIETFRNTMSRDFISEPDENSKPFLDDVTKVA